jgi:uncharacterized repeat protein (TIGR01451 family)
MGEPVTVTATVASNAETFTGDLLLPTGTVTFTIDGLAQAPTPIQDVDGKAVAALTTSSLYLGTHQIGASYSGDEQSAPSDAVPITVTVNPGTADLFLSASPAESANAGQPLTYVFSVDNYGPDPAFGVVLSDTLANGTTFVDGSVAGASAIVTNAGNQVTAELGNLGTGAHVVVTIDAMVAANAPSQIVNSASVSSSTNDPDIHNNAVTVVTQVSNGIDARGGSSSALTLSGAISQSSAGGHGEPLPPRVLARRDVIPAPVGGHPRRWFSTIGRGIPSVSRERALHERQFR